MPCKPALISAEICGCLGKIGARKFRGLKSKRGWKRETEDCQSLLLLWFYYVHTKNCFLEFCCLLFHRFRGYTRNLVVITAIKLLRLLVLELETFLFVNPMPSSATLPCLRVNLLVKFD